MDIERQLLLALDEGIIIAFGILACVLGYLYWFCQRIPLIGLSVEKSLKDKKAFGAFLGKWLLTIGLLTILFPFALKLVGKELWWIYAVIVLAAILRILQRCPGFYKK